MKSIHHVHKQATRVVKRLRKKKPDTHSFLVVISNLMKQVAHAVHQQTTHAVKHIKKHKRTYL